MVKRLVGFWEYSNALANLDKLLNLVTEEELRELDEYVKARSQFKVDVNESRTLQRGVSSLAEAVESDREKRGLDWIMALARIELASMMTGFTEVKRPFETVGPSRFEMDAYRYLLLDDLRTHYWALDNDPAVDRLLKSSDMMGLMTYSRRLLIVRSMLDAFAMASRPQLADVQVHELKGWKKNLDGMQTMFNARLRAFLAKHETVRTSKKTETREGYLSRICTAILNAERNELRSGDAKVYYNP